MPINKDEITKEMLEKAMQCNTAEELIAYTKTEGIDLTKEEAEAYFAELEDVELDSDALKQVAGGLCYSAGRFLDGRGVKMSINKNELTKELIQKAMACKTAEELMAEAKAVGYELTKDEADAYLTELSDFELDSEALTKVAGGGCYTECNSNNDCLGEH